MNRTEAWDLVCEFVSSESLRTHMACRVSDSIAGLIDRRHRLQVTFDLPSSERSISLCARITNKTPASEGCSILGLQFVTSTQDAAAIRDLRVAIEQISSAEEAVSL